MLRFQHPEFHGEIIAELERLRETDTVRVIDALAVHKDADGAIEERVREQPVQGRGDRARHQDRRPHRPRHRGRRGHGGGRRGRRRGAADGISAFADEDAWDIIEEIPNHSAAALLLVEHHWAVPLRDAIARAGGFRITDGLISPLDLIDIGLLSGEEAHELHAVESAPQRA